MKAAVLFRYVILLRGINVGGKNRIPMEELMQLLIGLGFEDVRTYIASGNVLMKSVLSPEEVRQKVETALPLQFALDSALVKVLVLPEELLRSVVADRPQGFGEHPDRYHSDVIFLMDIASEDAMAVFTPREGVDEVWRGNGVIYSQRLSAQRTKSRLNRIMGTPLYPYMTIRNWNTVTALCAMLDSK